jgi:uncharacterized protein (DUF3084 family)
LLNNDESRTNSWSPFTMIISRARTPALMLAAAANATATPAPARLFSISLPNNEQVFDDKSGGEGWQNDALG